jgi:cyclic pyranopterin phosphate synthase
MTHLDSFLRPIEYLRVSVTDRCNLRCVYCMPPEGVPQCPHDAILRYEEIEIIVRAAAELGIHKVRLTGGEPLARLGLSDLVRRLAAIPGIDDLSMTTNGTLLARHAQELKDAGLKRVNISLDTLRPDRFTAITRRGRLEDALAGIEAAHRVGLEPVKLNMVVMRGVNDDEVVDMARKTISDGWQVRFIEWMPVGESGGDLTGESTAQGVMAAEIRATIEATLGPLEPASVDVGGGPARYYRLPGASGTVWLHHPHQRALLPALQPPAPHRRRAAPPVPALPISRLTCARRCVRGREPPKSRRWCSKPSPSSRSVITWPKATAPPPVPCRKSADNLSTNSTDFNG